MIISNYGWSFDEETFNKNTGKYKLYESIEVGRGLFKDKLIEEKFINHKGVGLLNQHYKSFKLNKEWRSK